LKQGEQTQTLPPAARKFCNKAVAGWKPYSFLSA